MKTDKQYDYIIVGAGSAGCVLANKLGSDITKSILVIEAGPMDSNLMIHIPAGVASAWRNPRLNWNYYTQAEATLNNRHLFMPRGKVVGGSSSINSMVYMRGHPLDYDAWSDDFGLHNWRYANCLPYFKAGENYLSGGNDWRGNAGALSVCRGSFENPLYDAFCIAGEQAGQGQSDDLNGFKPEGVARLDATKIDGRRCSAAVAHLRPALKRGNVTLLTHALVGKIIIENSNASAIAVNHNNVPKVFEANREIILSGGAINSPHLLMLSGIGPADHLREHNIAVHADLPGVGKNLQDHAGVIAQYKSLKQYPVQRVDRPWNKFSAGVRWVFTRDGIAASNIWEAGGLIRSNHEVAFPNLQYHFGPVGFDYRNGKIILNQAFAIHIDQLKPRSRGSVQLTSANPVDHPSLRFNYLQHNTDLQELVEGVHRVRELVSQSAFSGLAGEEIKPGKTVRSDEDIKNWIRSATETDFHPCGTCRMGNDEQAVVDSQCRVRGINKLRVVDASVIPRITSANLNAPTQMIAAKVADYIANVPQLEPEYKTYSFN